MGRVLFSIVFLFGAIVLLPAQDVQPKWVDVFEEIQVTIDECILQEDWKTVVGCMKKQHKLFYGNPLEERMMYFDSEKLYPEFFYNFACYWALTGNKSRAIKAFEEYTKYIVNGECEADLLHLNSDADLDLIRSNKRFIACIEKIKPIGDYIQKLKDASSYSDGTAHDDVKFRYMDSGDSNLVFLRHYYRLDSVAGDGDEISKIKNLLHWVHEIVPHDGNSSLPVVRNAHAMIELCKREDRGLNCRMMAQILTEVYLAMGFKARLVTCLPRDYVDDCHVIATVFSTVLNKWVWVDPTFDAYVMDELGIMLSISEVRSRLRQDLVVRLNDYANWNHEIPQTDDDYLKRYMAKNLYYISCMEDNRYDAETWNADASNRYYILVPSEELEKDIKGISPQSIRLSDEACFWQPPIGLDVNINTLPD